MGGVLGERWHFKLIRRAISGKDRDQRHVGDDHAHAVPTPRPDERDQAGPGRSEHDRSDSSGASHID